MLKNRELSGIIVGGYVIGAILGDMIGVLYESSPTKWEWEDKGFSVIFDIPMFWMI